MPYCRDAPARIYLSSTHLASRCSDNLTGRSFLCPRDVCESFARRRRRSPPPSAMDSQHFQAGSHPVADPMCVRFGPPAVLDQELREIVR